jgi:FkbM family methyltransferase
VGRAFHEYAEYSEGEVTLFRELVHPGDVVCDIGANIGAFTVPLAQLVGPEGGVLAFEPQPFLYYLLCGNVAQNSLQHVICERSILSERPGVTRIPAVDYGQPGNFGGFACGQLEGKKGIPTNISTLDAYHLTRCDFLKIDVEGMERQVLLGAARTIAKHRPILYVENDRADNSFALLEVLAKLGYEWRLHEPPLFNAQNHAGNAENVFPNLVSRNLMCAPKR